MSDRPIDHNLTTETNKTIDSEKHDITPEDFKKRLASVLDRGFTVDRLTVNVPPDQWGEWIPNDDASLARADLLGFTPAPHLIANQKINDNGTQRQGVGDVIFMTQPMWMHQMIEKKRREDYARNHLQTKQREEKDFINSNAKIDMPAHANSEAIPADGHSIKDALKPTT